MDDNVRAGELIHHDKDGNEYVLDEMGNKRPPMQCGSQFCEISSGFTIYNSPDHCGLCGRLTCRGNCFK